MKHETARFDFQFNNNAIFYQSWQPDTDSSAIVLLVHGLAEHSSRYQEFAEYLVSQDYLVAALDLPGHGQSHGAKAYFNRFSDHQHAVEHLRQIYAQLYPSKKIFLLGHSMGGLVSSSVMLDAQQHYAGCILSGAALKTALQPPAIQIWLINFLSRLLPRLGVMQLDSAAVSRDPEVVKAYLDDPLVYAGKVSARCAAEMFKAMHRVKEHNAQIEIPLLILHGEADDLTAPEGSRELYNNVSSQDKTLRIYPQLYHEILNEAERDQVYGDIVEWLAVRV